MSTTSALVTDAQMCVLSEFERWAADGVNTHLGLKRRVLAAVVAKGLLAEVPPRDPDESIRFALTPEGRRVLAAWQRKTRPVRVSPADAGRLL